MIGERERETAKKREVMPKERSDSERKKDRGKQKRAREK